jgi:RNA recognition motif-containing protein
MNIFVARLSSATTAEDLEKIFGEFGEVVSAKIIFDKETKNSKGYGFVEMKDDAEAKAAITALNETEVDGKQIVVKEAKPREEYAAPRKTLRKRDNQAPEKNNYGT